MEQDWLIVLAGLIGLSVLAWAYLMWDAGTVSCLAMPRMGTWGARELWLTFAMWAIMMVAMMVPSAAPMVLTFALVNRKRQEQAQPFVPTSVFLAGYLIVWTLFSAAAALAQWGLHKTALLSSAMVLTNPAAGIAVLLAAGVFQFTPLKRACLVHCRTPLTFLMTEWREGARGALIMGLRHGVFCLGCCWFLMGLLFVAGVMNLLWVAAISLLVLAEKAAPAGHRVSWAAGLLLIGWSAWMTVGALR